MTNTCPRCGARNRDTAHFCWSCGQRLGITGGVFDPATGRLQPGSLLDGRYYIVRLLSSKGAMGAVYLAQDQRLGNETCAVKEMLDNFQDPGERQRAIQWFEREALLLRRLQHPHIPRVIDHFTERGRHYLVMDYIEGETLESVLARQGGRGLPEESVIEWAVQICDVLEYLHGQQPPIIFRDIKPSNIMLDPRGQIKLIDFGIARIFESGRPGTMVGTPGYAPIEQYQGMAEPRSDIYALGATLHHLVTAQEPTPFTFPPVRTLNPTISTGLEAVIAKAVSFQAADRQQSVGEMRAELENLNAAFNLSVDFVHPILDMHTAPLCQFMLSAVSKGATDRSMVQNHYCLVLDVSGSMHFDAQGKDVSQQKYWPLLEATRCLIDDLSDSDLLTIIVFAEEHDLIFAARLVDECRRMNIDKAGGVIDGSRRAQEPGNATNLRGALSQALEIIDQFQKPNVVHRILLLTDGKIFDADACNPLFDQIRSSATEIYAYGFGTDWQPENLEPVRACRGGTVKPISTNPTVTTYDITNSFSRFARAKQNVVATDVELEVSFTPNVKPGDAFRYSPVSRLLGSDVYTNNVLRIGVEALERGREYAWCFEARLQPATQSPQQIGTATLRYTYQGKRVIQRQPIWVERHPDERRFKLKRDDVEEVFAFLELLRSNDPQKQLRALEARLDIALRRGYDPEHIAALRQGIDALRRGDRLEELPLQIQIWLRTDPRGFTQKM